jgi:hypothetical protein
MFLFSKSDESQDRKCINKRYLVYWPSKFAPNVASIQETEIAAMASADPAFAGIVCASNFKHIDLIDLIGPFANGRNYEIGSGVRAKTMGSRDFV